MPADRASIQYHLEEQVEGDNRKRVGDVREQEITLTTAEILALFTTPKELVEAPGANKVIQFMGAVGFLDFNSAAYTTRGILTVKEVDGSGTAVSDAMAANVLVQLSADGYAEFAKLSAEATLLANVALVLTCDTGNPVVGDSPIRIKIFYRILDFS
jgi:hypothetical protein